MKKLACILGLLLILIGCGSSTSTTTGGTNVGGTDTGTTTTLTTNEEAMINLPSPDPSSMDYSIASASSSLSAVKSLSKASGEQTSSQVGCMIDALYTIGVQSVRQLERMFLCKARGAFVLASEGSANLTLSEGGEVYLQFAGGDGGESDVAKITHTAGNGLGTFKIYQCSGNTQIGYASFDVTATSYTGTALFRRDGSECIKATYTRNTSALTDSDFDGSVNLNFASNGENAILILGADGTTQTNTLQGKKNGSQGGLALGYWESAAGCGQGVNGSDEDSGEVPFDLSVDSDGNKTYSTYSGSDSASLCANLPAIPTVEACPEFSELTDATWDCDVSEKTVVEFSSASALEDAGGSRCVVLSDAFASREANPSACFE